MALGAGSYTTQNKILPGTYINFISTTGGTVVSSERGTAAIGLNLTWGAEGTLIELTQTTFIKNSLKLFGLSYSAEELAPIREVLCNASKVYVYKLNGGGEKASNAYCAALYGGTGGNNLKTVIQVNADDESLYDVTTYLGTTAVDSQTVASAADLVDNDYVTFDTTATLTETSGTALTGGTDGETEDHAGFLAALESCTGVNAVGTTGDSTIAATYSEWAKSMRDEYGIKLQVVVYNYAADSEAVVNVINSAETVYWVTGVVAGTAVNRSAANLLYNGELDIPVAFTQSELETAIQNGQFVLHKVGDNIRVLDDINSLVTVTDSKGEVFKQNKTIRIIDKIASDVASTFVSYYLGTVANDEAGRESLWADILTILESLSSLSAIGTVSDSDVTVTQGDDKNSVEVTVVITVNGTMTKLYMECTVN